MNIAQEDDSNIFKLFKNLWLNNLQFIIFKCCRFCLFIAFVFILLLLYTQTFLILYFLNTLLFQPSPPLRLLALDIFSNLLPNTESAHSFCYL